MGKFYDRCWPYTGYIAANGYAQSQGMIHRRAYEVLVGPIPAGLQLDHLCRNKSCYNPTHLEPVTAKENVRRSLPYRQSQRSSPPESLASKPRKSQPRHGTLSEYNNQLCRCAECKAANAASTRKRKERFYLAKINLRIKGVPPPGIAKRKIANPKDRTA